MINLNRTPSSFYKVLVALVFVGLVLITLFNIGCTKHQFNNIQFYTQKTPQSTTMHAELSTKAKPLLIDSEGCLRVKEYTLIWPHGFQLVANKSSWSILDSNDMVVVNIGDKIIVGGGECTQCDHNDFIQQLIGFIPETRCQTKYWIVSEVY